MNETRLFRAQTIEQFRIHQWLVQNGLAPEAVKDCQLPDRNVVVITDPFGAWGKFTWENGVVREEYGAE